MSRHVDGVREDEGKVGVRKDRGDIDHDKKPVVMMTDKVG